MIFGLALSVGAITLVSSPPTNVGGIENDVATFGFSFFILITIWLRYTRIMSVLPLQSQRVVNLNIILLFLVSLEPFFFNIVNNPPSLVTDPGAYGDATSTMYALDIAAMMFILGFFTLTVADEERKLIPKELVRQFKRESAIWLITGCLYLVTVLPFFYTHYLDGIRLRYVLWIVPQIFIFASRASGRLAARRRAAASASEPVVPSRP